MNHYAKNKTLMPYFTQHFCDKTVIVQTSLLLERQLVGTYFLATIQCCAQWSIVQLQEVRGLD